MRTDEKNPRSGEGLVRAGAVIFAIGLVATIVTVVPLFLDAEPMPAAIYGLAMLAPLGFGLALLGILRAARARRRT